MSCAGTLKKRLPSGSPKSSLIEFVNEPLTTIGSNEPICSHMCTEMPNLKANFPYFLDEVNPERLVARPKGIATKWYTLPKSKTMSKSEPKEPKERKEAN